MADLTLGLDLGPQSIGWALVDEEGERLVGTGVRVFPEGGGRDTKGAELSKNEARRKARGMRRQIRRRAERRRKLRELLVSAKLLPEAAAKPADDPQRVAWESMQFDREDPYSLRRRALSERLELHELGRVLVHLNQRRGFQSNRKANRERKKENSDMLKEISDLADTLDGRTLGQYLAERRDRAPHTRLRGLHTHRTMLQDEFERIWAAQKAHHPELLSDDLKQRIARVVFYQRPMYWPKSVIGACELDPRLPRCPRGDRRAQRFRLLLEVNNLRVLDRSTGVERALSAEERTRLIVFLAAKKDRSFDEIRRHLFEEHEGIRFNLEAGDRSKLKGLPTDALLAGKSYFGKAWAAMEEWKKNRIVTTILEGEEGDFVKLADDLDLNPALARKLADVELEDGYASYSLCAIKRLLPHLEAGLPLSSRDASMPCALHAAGYILPWERRVDRQTFLPEPPVLTNPLVGQALHEVRKVVNAILREMVYREGHRLARIHIELAREVRGTAEHRRRLIREMRDREARRDAAADAIREQGIKATREAIDRYLLWEEQDKQCIYSGRTISVAQLLGGEVDVDHILPYPRSLDNSMMNRVVCFRDENRDKLDRTPFEWLAERNPARYEEILQRADCLPHYQKAKRFRQRSIELDDFFARQFVDTTYITTQVHHYVQCLGADVLCPKGQHTAELRWQWGLDTVLRDDGLDLKNREDHRHHAVDAVVIALTNRSRLQQLAKLRRRGGPKGTGEVLNEPWRGFRQAVEEAVNAVNVSHRVRRKVSGALHEDTLYGGTDKPGEFVYRKPLETLTPNMVEDICDPMVRSLIKKRLAEFGVSRDAAKIPAQVWSEPLYMYAPRSGERHAIRHVRLVRRDRTIRPIRTGTAYVKPGRIHHLCIFELRGASGRPVRDCVFVSMLEATERLRAKRPVIERKHPTRPDGKFKMSLSTGESVLLVHGGREGLYCFETASSTTKQMSFRHHTAGGKRNDKRGVVSKMPGTLIARKVVVDPIGRIRWAND